MIDYKKFKIEILDPISPTFCASKWHQADFWLESGTTSSCHLPAPHKIDLEEISRDIQTFHNTKEKLAQKNLMLQGQKPKGCSNCWQVEELDPDAISERIGSSYNMREYESDFSKLDLSSNHVPAKVTVAFESYCNFTCSYCDATQSSSWATDLKINGPYKRINGDTRNTYQRLGTSIRLSPEQYQYVSDKFTEYVITNLSEIKFIRCLGGEPLISNVFWKFLSSIVEYDCSNIVLSIVTNLSDVVRIHRFLSTYQDKFKKIVINISIEAIGKHGEFLRTGFKWNKFQDNLNQLMDKNIGLNIIATYPGIALDGIVEFLNWYNRYRERISLDLYRLRYPNFQAIQVLPFDLKKMYLNQIEKWIEQNKDYFETAIFNVGLENIVTILKNDCTMYDNTDVQILRQSAKEFYKQYAERHKHDIRSTFSEPMANWILN